MNLVSGAASTVVRRIVQNASFHARMMLSRIVEAIQKSVGAQQAAALS